MKKEEGVIVILGGMGPQASARLLSLIAEKAAADIKHSVFNVV